MPALFELTDHDLHTLAVRVQDDPRIEITTPFGETYIIHRNGNIERCSVPGLLPSGHWKFLGLVCLRPTYFVPFEKITQKWMEANRPGLLFKNGKPRWTVRDLDHGTVREWGNTEFHGVRSIRFL